MTLNDKQLNLLRVKITEGLRMQRDTTEPVPYMDAANIVADVCARQNHTIFARRGCGKTLLLHHSTKELVGTKIRTVYLNCEDFKRHSFPNVLIEILDALFRELENNLHGWFGRSKRAKELIQTIRKDLAALRQGSEIRDETIKSTVTKDNTTKVDAQIGGKVDFASFKFGATASINDKLQTERSYSLRSEKLRDLDLLLPRLKEQIREFFTKSSSVKSVFLQIDDLYHLKKTDQPFVIDYIHRLCKDVPLYFKVATLRHASSLYLDLSGQPIGKR